MSAVSAVRTTKPESATDLTRLVETHLRRAGVAGVLPTPVDTLIAAARIRQVADPEAARDQFLATLAEEARWVFQSAWQKIRGIADLRENTIYVPRADTPPRLLWVKAHEFGHEVIPWHRLDLYRDDNLTLGSEAEHLFDAEANYFAGELLFQGHRFRTRALDYRPSLAAVFRLADEYGASRQATLRRYVEDHDEAVALVTYLRSRYQTDRTGKPLLYRPWVTMSPRFLRRFADVRLPDTLPAGHPWADALTHGDVCSGELGVETTAGEVRFEWQSWWNGYALFVLLRRKPVLGFLGRLVRGG